jgi:hypothetical protein
MKFEKEGFELKGMKLGYMFEDGSKIIGIEEGNDYLDVCVHREGCWGEAPLSHVDCMDEDVECYALEEYYEAEDVEWMCSIDVKMEIEEGVEKMRYNADEYKEVATVGLSEALLEQIKFTEERVAESGFLNCSLNEFIVEFIIDLEDSGDGMLDNMTARERYLFAFGYCSANFDRDID